jgi:hypothetical protein
VMVKMLFLERDARARWLAAIIGAAK